MAERRDQLTEVRDNLDQRILSLLEHKHIAAELGSNEIKLIKAGKRFYETFTTSLNLENGETKEATAPKSVRYIEVMYSTRISC